MRWPLYPDGCFIPSGRFISGGCYKDPVAFLFPVAVLSHVAVESPVPVGVLSHLAVGCAVVGLGWLGEILELNTFQKALNEKWVFMKTLVSDCRTYDRKRINVRSSST